MDARSPAFLYSLTHSSSKTLPFLQLGGPGVGRHTGRMQPPIRANVYRLIVRFAPSAARQRPLKRAAQKKALHPRGIMTVSNTSSMLLSTVTPNSTKSVCTSSPSGEEKKKPKKTHIQERQKFTVQNRPTARFIYDVDKKGGIGRSRKQRKSLNGSRHPIGSLCSGSNWGL